jgi:hypothetical protein
LSALVLFFPWISVEPGVDVNHGTKLDGVRINQKTKKPLLTPFFSFSMIVESSKGKEGFFFWFRVTGLSRDSRVPTSFFDDSTRHLKGRMKFGEIWQCLVEY